MKLSIKNKENSDALEEPVKSKEQLNEVRLQAKTCEKGFNYDAKGLFEPITKPVSDTSGKVFQENKSTTRTIEALNQTNVQVKISELRNKNGVFNTTLIRSLAKY